MIVRTFLILALLLCCLSPAAAQLAPAPNYATVDNGTPLAPLAGKVEVVEVFAYTCGHCANFQRLVDTWLRKAPAHLRFTYLPAAFNPNDPYARAYFAAESLGVLKTFHQKMFDAIHRDGTLPGRGATIDEIAAFAGRLGINAARFKTAMTSPATDAKMTAAREFAIRSGIEGTPTLVVNGRYRVQGRSLEHSLQVADELIARERAAQR